MNLETQEALIVDASRFDQLSGLFEAIRETASDRDDDSLTRQLCAIGIHVATAWGDEAASAYTVRRAENVREAA